MRVELDVDLGSGRKAPSPTRQAKPEKRNQPSQSARLIALARHLQHLLDTGQAKDLSHLASMTGVSRARISQIMDLLLLAPDIQASALHRSDSMPSEQLRCLTGNLDWKRQRSLLS